MHFILSGDDSAIKLVGSLIVLGSMGIVTGYRAFRAKRNVEDTACSKVVSAPQGLVELQGQAWPTATLRSVDGRLLSYWHLQVQRYQRRGKSSGWVTVYNFQSSDPIILTDGSASCLIVPEKAEVIAIESTYPNA